MTMLYKTCGVMATANYSPTEAVRLQKNGAKIICIDTDKKCRLLALVLRVRSMKAGHQF